jgi:4-hydroxy-3-polyprenylbenzoate decarboxylase
VRVVLGITGASGVGYGVRLAQELAKRGVDLVIVVSEAGRKVLGFEVPEGLGALETIGRVLRESEIDADVASGSAKFDATVICPCSMKTLSAIANGYSDNLICRNADVALKEHRRLVLVVRETPLSAIHLENMLKLARLGVVILPASPGFYHKPKTVEDLVDHVVGKIMDTLGIESNLFFSPFGAKLYNSEGPIEHKAAVKQETPKQTLDELYNSWVQICGGPKCTVNK